MASLDGNTSAYWIAECTAVASWLLLVSPPSPLPTPFYIAQPGILNEAFTAHALLNVVAPPPKPSSPSTITAPGTIIINLAVLGFVKRTLL